MNDQRMPEAVAAERAILGAILLDGGIIYDAAKDLAPEDFSTDANRVIFTQMCLLSDAREPIDLITLDRALKSGKDLERVGGIAYVASLTDGVARRTSIAHYTKMVKQAAMLRRLIHIGNTLIEEAFSPDAKAEVLAAQVQEAILGMAQSEDCFRLLSDVMRDSVAKLQELRNSASEGCLGLTTTLPSLDAGTGGIRDGELWIVGARPNVGKTPFGMQIATEAGQKGKKVLVFSLEMEDTQLANRCLSHAGLAHPSDVRDPRYARNWQAIENAPNIFADWPIWIDDSPDLSIKELRHRARFARARMGIDLIVVDYVQLVKAPGKSEFEQVTNTAKGLRLLARETRCPTVALSQLSRDAKDPKREPTIGDLRSSGELEQAAHVIGLLHREREKQPDGSERMAKNGKMIMGKVREGEGGNVDIHLDVPTLRFVEGWV